MVKKIVNPQNRHSKGKTRKVPGGEERSARKATTASISASLPPSKEDGRKAKRFPFPLINRRGNDTLDTTEQTCPYKYGTKKCRTARAIPANKRKQFCDCEGCKDRIAAESASKLRVAIAIDKHIGDRSIIGKDEAETVDPTLADTQLKDTKEIKLSDTLQLPGDLREILS